MTKWIKGLFQNKYKSLYLESQKKRHELSELLANARTQSFQYEEQLKNQREKNTRLVVEINQLKSRIEDYKIKFQNAQGVITRLKVDKQHKESMQ